MLSNRDGRGGGGGGGGGGAQQLQNPAWQPTMSPVEQQSSQFDMPSPLSHLHLEAGDPAFIRRVELLGSESGRRYASAISLLNPATLDTKLFHELIDENVGMGEVLRNSARGSYREVLDIRRESEDSVTRTYAVILATRPAILISERFYLASFLRR